jgi:lincosamide nucleotidyltransferase A/C/D/E
MISEMNSACAVALIRWLECEGIALHVDGGWGVDALIGEQTRAHADLDIAINHEDVPKLRDLFKSRGYREVQQDDTRDYNFVLVDDQGHSVDVHSYLFDENGNNIYGCDYPIDALQGRGYIENLPVHCITPEWLVRFHSGYPLQQKDFHDVELLCHRFGIDLPKEYTACLSNGSQSEK